MLQVEIVEIGALFGGTLTEREAVDCRIWQAARATGAFVVTGYPGAERIDAGAQAALAFFDLPMAARRAVGTQDMTPDNANRYRGYRATLDGGWAHNEYYDVGPEAPKAGPDLPGISYLIERTPWPEEGPYSDWPAQVRAFYDDLSRLGLALIASLGRSAGFDEVTIAKRFEGGNSTLRLLNYPVPPAGSDLVDHAPAEEEGGQRLSARRHTDQSGLSLLWQRDPGLQAEAPDGQWYDIPARDNAVSVHFGEIMRTLTSGRVVPTPHRVLELGEPRQSIGFFVEPGLGASLAPADRNPDPSDPSQTYAWALLNRLASYPQFSDVLKPLG